MIELASLIRDIKSAIEVHSGAFSLFWELEDRNPTTENSNLNPTTRRRLFVLEHRHFLAYLVYDIRIAFPAFCYIVVRSANGMERKNGMR